MRHWREVWRACRPYGAFRLSKDATPGEERDETSTAGTTDTTTHHHHPTTIPQPPTNTNTTSRPRTPLLPRTPRPPIPRPPTTTTNTTTTNNILLTWHHIARHNQKQRLKSLLVTEIRWQNCDWKVTPTSIRTRLTPKPVYSRQKRRSSRLRGLFPGSPRCRLSSTGKRRAYDRSLRTKPTDNRRIAERTNAPSYLENLIAMTSRARRLRRYRAYDSRLKTEPTDNRRIAERPRASGRENPIGMWRTRVHTGQGITDYVTKCTEIAKTSCFLIFPKNLDFIASVPGGRFHFKEFYTHKLLGSVYKWIYNIYQK